MILQQGLCPRPRSRVLPLRLVFEAIRGGLAGSTVVNAKAPMMIAGSAIARYCGHLTGIKIAR